MAWAWSIRNQDGPSLIILTRQKLDLIPRGDGFDGKAIARGAYVLDRYSEGDVTLIATGSELTLAVKTADKLRAEGVQARVVSAPCLDIFDRQPKAYQDEVLGDRDRIIAIEAGRSDGWYKYVSHKSLVIGIDRFGASAPAERIAEEFGFTPEKIAAKVRTWRQA
jgi:transketolase